MLYRSNSTIAISDHFIPFGSAGSLGASAEL